MPIYTKVTSVHEKTQEGKLTFRKTDFFGGKIDNNSETNSRIELKFATRVL